MVTDEQIYKKQVCAFDKKFKVWMHSDGLMVIGHEARLITPYNVEEELLGFFAVFESPSRGETLKRKLIEAGAHIKAYGLWEMTGYFSYEKLPVVAKALNIAAISEKKRELGKLAMIRMLAIKNAKNTGGIEAHPGDSV
jgi:hypothetical protein